MKEISWVDSIINEYYKYKFISINKLPFYNFLYKNIYYQNSK